MLSEGARPTQGLIFVSRVRRRDAARSFDSGEGSSLSDSVRPFSTPSAAVTGEDVRIGWEIGNLRICCSAVCCERARQL